MPGGVCSRASFVDNRDVVASMWSASLSSEYRTDGGGGVQRCNRKCTLSLDGSRAGLVRDSPRRIARRPRRGGGVGLPELTMSRTCLAM